MPTFFSRLIFVLLFITTCSAQLGYNQPVNGEMEGNQYLFVQGNGDADAPESIYPPTSPSTAPSESASSPIDPLLWVMRLRFTFTIPFQTEIPFSTLPQYTSSHQLILLIPAIASFANLSALTYVPLSESAVDYFIPYWYTPPESTTNTNNSDSKNESGEDDDHHHYERSSGSFKIHPNAILHNNTLDSNAIQQLMVSINQKSYIVNNDKGKPQPLPGHLKSLSIHLKHNTRQSCFMFHPLEASRYCNIPARTGSSCQSNQDCVETYAHCADAVCTHKNSSPNLPSGRWEIYPFFVLMIYLAIDSVVIS